MTRVSLFLPCEAEGIHPFGHGGAACNAFRPQSGDKGLSKDSLLEGGSASSKSYSH
jgi:hypothetical protein